MTALILLEKLISCAPSSFKEKRNLNILVIAAGSFPSVFSLVHNLLKISKKLTSIHFIILEPDYQKTDFFVKYIFPSAERLTQISLTYEIKNIYLATYLKTYHSNQYDLIYFEHPDMRAINILYHKICGILTMRFSMREPIPYLANVLKPDSLIVASCITQHELIQLKYLLEYSFNSKVVHFNIYNNDSYRGFKYGLSFVPKTIPILVEREALKIKISDNFLFLCITIAIIICYHSVQSKHFFAMIIVPFIFIAQLFFHRPGIFGALIQCGLIIGYIFIVKNFLLL